MEGSMNVARPVSIFRICAPRPCSRRRACCWPAAPTCPARAGRRRRPRSSPTRVAPIEWRDTIEALGTARANESVTLTAKVSETVRKVAFDSGDIVRAGDVIVDLSSGAQLAGLEEARASFQEAERQLARGQELAPTKVISESQLDTLRSTRDAAKARMDVVRAQLSDRVITAPFDGILGLRQVSPGSLVTPGTAIATLDDISVIKLDFTVPERYLAVLARGQDVAAKSETYPDRKFAGRIASVDSRVDPVTRSVTVRAEIPNADRLLRPGMLMSLDVFLAPRQAVVVPEIAVLQVGADAFVYRVKADQTVERAKIELGSRRQGEVEVRAGLGDGDRVVTEGTVKLREGVSVVEAGARAARGRAVNLSDLSIRRPVFATVMSLLLVVLGVIAYSRLTLRELPAIDPPIVSVEVSYPGASAAVVETRVTQILEDSLSGIEGVETIDSRSRNGESSISIEFSLSRDIEAAANDVRDAVSRVLDRMPQEADPPEIEKAESDSEVILWLNMRSTRMDTLQLTDYAYRYVLDRLSAIDGVAQVRLGGSQRYAMRVWLDASALAARRLTVADVEAVLERENIELPAGRIESTDRDFTLRVQRGYREPEDFAQLTLAKGEDGYLVRLGDVARVERAAGRAALVPAQQRRAQRRARDHQDLDGEQPRRRARRARDRRGDPEDAARGHADLRRLRQHGLHRRRGRARLHDAAGGHRAGGRGDLPVPRQRALGADSRGDDTGVPGHGVRGAVGLRLLDQPADPARDRALHRPGRGRRDRRGREHPAPRRPRRAAAGGGEAGHGAGVVRGGRDHGRAGRRVPAGRLHGGQHRAACSGSCRSRWRARSRSRASSRSRSRR